MNKLLTGIVLVCFSIGAIAQEKQIWACQQQAGTMLRWESDRWETYGVAGQPILVTIDEASSNYKEGKGRLRSFAQFIFHHTYPALI